MNELPDVLAFLADLPGFELLDEAAQRRAAAGLQISYVTRGSAILEAGATNETVYVVRSGAVELLSEHGELQMRLGEGECFGFPAVMEQRAVRRDAVAYEDTLLYELSADAFNALRQSSAGFDAFFVRQLADRLLLAESAAPYKGALEQPISTLLSREPVTMPRTASIRETAEAMVKSRVSAMLIANDDGQQCIGIVTDRDMRSRVVALGTDPSLPISDIMTESPIVLDASAKGFEAALTMMQHEIHHIPVVRDEALVGMVSRSDFMRLETEHPLYLISDIGKQRSATGLVETCQRLPALIAGQIEAGASGEQLGKYITSVTDAITRALVRIAINKLGDPPCAFAWVAMGSQGRGEQSAKSDQDNALVLSDDATPEMDEYFAALAQIVNDGLDGCGYVYCPGEVMASNPKWRQPLAQWKRYFDRWISVPEQKALMHANIFFDLRAVAGSADLVDQLKQSISASAKNNEIFLALMAKNAMSFQPPLGLFRQFVLERGGEHADTLDIKLRGIMPIVEIARIRSLAAGQMRIGTRNRLKAAASAGELTTKDAANLRDALDFIERLRLEHQSEQMSAGRAPDNHLAPDRLSSLNRQNLKAAFAQVRTSQAALLNRFHLA